MAAMKGLCHWVRVVVMAMTGAYSKAVPAIFSMMGLAMVVAKITVIATTILGIARNGALRSEC